SRPCPVACHLQRVGDRPGTRRTVAYHDDPLDSQEMGASIRLGVETPPQFLEYRAHLGASRFVEVADGFAHHSNRHRGGALHGLWGGASGAGVAGADVGVWAAEVGPLGGGSDAMARFAEARVSWALQLAALAPFRPILKPSPARVVEPEEHLWRHGPH